MVMSNSNLDAQEIRQIRDSLVDQRAINRANIEKAAKAKEAVKKIFESFDEEVVLRLATRGVDIRTLLGYDLELVGSDKEYADSFSDEYRKVMGELKQFIEKGLK
jgi:N-methylhydantoinase A/oxoprolinase/acetone carboxylase beta subunit